MSKPKFGETDFMPWVDRQLAKREILRANRKIQQLEKELDKQRKLRNKNLEFEFAFRKFLVRFEGRKYDSDWPIARFGESVYYLKGLLP